MNKIIIDGVDYSKNAVFPLKIRGLLDRSLDQATITLRNLSEDKPFEPLSKVEIFEHSTLVGSLNADYTFLIANDSVKRDLYGSQVRYTHELLLIEETKLLEKYFVDTCTFTNSLAKNYDMNPVDVLSNTMTLEELNKYWEEYKEKTGTGTPEETGYTPEIDTDLRGTPNDQFYQSPVIYEAGNTFINLTMAKAYFSSGSNTVTSSGDTYMAYRLYDKDYNLKYSNMSQNLGEVYGQISTSGTYYAEFVCLKSSYSGILGRTYSCYGIKFILSLIDTTNIMPASAKITITDVVNRLLAITETQRVGETPRFSFNTEQATQYSSVYAPEFAITKSTLREALQQVGSFIHAEPRLKGNVIYFDDLGKREFATIPQNYVSYTNTQDIEQFCSEIDSNVENLVNTDDEQIGTIIEPFDNGLKTTRVEVGTVDITDSNAFIETTKPIEKIVKVEFGFLNGGVAEVGDITPYIYESAEYSVLDSYDGVYPYSKAWALYYTQGQKNIYGLQFEQADAVSPYFQKFAIINILERITGTTISAIDNPLAKMQFRITYIPVVNMRIKQHKSYLGSTKRKSVLNYNASANKVDTDYYGENLKGAVERLGNIEKTITYCTKDLQNIPSAGMLFDKDYYISVITIEFLQNYYRFTLGLSKDFNRWNEYVGINNNQRFYEVSEKQSVERYTIFEDYLIIGNYVNIESNSYQQSIAGKGIFDTLKQNFTPTIDGYSRAVTSISFTGYDANNNIISTITMPAVSFALGNSVIYQMSMDNNFGAGTYIQQYLTNAKGVQIQKEYGDIYGNIETIKIEGYAQPLIASPSTYSEAVNEGSQVPNITPDNTIKEFSTGSANIILKKDSRENINFAYQIHCVTNMENVIIGSGLSKKLSTMTVSSTLDNYSPQYVDMYIMPREIGKFEKVINDLPNISDKISYTLTSDDAINKYLYFDTITCNKDGKSIIMVNRDTNELIFAINDTFINGEDYEMPKMMFRHKIYN